MTMDLRCYTDLDPFGEECATPLEELEQDVIHRVTTRRGSNLDDPDFGESVFDWLSAAAADTDAMRAELEAEIAKDPRVASVTVTVEKPEDGIYLVTLAIETDEGELLSPQIAVDETGARKVG
jgi:phage baseplate assembly protein W